MSDVSAFTGTTTGTSAHIISVPEQEYVYKFTISVLLFESCYLFTISPS